MNAVESKTSARRCARTCGGFVNPEKQILIALYAVHFAIWVPVALRLPAATELFKFVVIGAPVVLCHGLSALRRWLSKKLWRGDPFQWVDTGVWPVGHLLVLIFTVFSFFLAKLVFADAP